MSAMGLILVASVTWTSCNGFETWRQDTSGLRHAIWEKEVCSHLAHEGYRGAEYSIVSMTKKDLTAMNPNSVADKFEIGNIKAGRLLVSGVSDGNKSLDKNSFTDIWLKVRASKLAWVVVRDIKAGESIKKRDVSFEEADVAPFVGVENDRPRVDNPIGLRAKNALKAGAIITDKSLLANPYLKRGVLVDVFIVKGAVKIMAKAEVLTDVYDLDRVHIKLENSDAQLVGSLTSDGKVVVEL